MVVGIESRWDRRLVSNIRVELYHSRFLKCGGRVRNISAGGIFTATHAPLERGSSVVRVKASVPDAPCPRFVWFDALVIWLARAGAGMMFCQDDDVLYPLLEGVRPGRLASCPSVLDPVPTRA